MTKKAIVGMIKVEENCSPLLSLHKREEEGEKVKEQKKRNQTLALLIKKPPQTEDEYNYYFKAVQSIVQI